MFARELRALQRVATKEGRRMREINGLICGYGSVLRIVQTENLSARPGSFRLAMRDWRTVERACGRLGFAIVGTFHSHVGSAVRPGRGDLLGAFSGDLMLILDANGSEARLWRIRNGKALKQPLILLDDRRPIAAARRRRL